MSFDFFARLAEMAPDLRSAANEDVLFRQGDRVRHLFLVSRGEAQLVRRQADGSALILQRAGPGTILAEGSVHSDRHHCDGVVTIPARLYRLPMPAVRAAFASDSALALELSRHLSEALREARLRAEILSLRTVADRLDAWLGWQQGRLPPRGKWRQLAEELGVSDAALYREIARRNRREV